MLYKNSRWILEKKANGKMKQSLWRKHLFLSIQEVNIFSNLLWLGQNYKNIVSSFCQAHSNRVIWHMVTQWEGYLNKINKTHQNPHTIKESDWELLFCRFESIMSAAPALLFRFFPGSVWGRKNSCSLGCPLFYPPFSPHEGSIAVT